MNNASSRISSAAESGGDAAREVFGNAKESIYEAGDAVRKAARETANDAVKAGREQAGRAVGAAQDAAYSISSYVRAKPVEAALIGLSGLLLASLLLRRR
jgi:ElaB/YqjD/DUF883 family membrane-anchored ribosome-binding protein